MNKYSDYDKSYLKKYKRNFFKEAMQATVIFGLIILAIYVMVKP